MTVDVTAAAAGPSADALAGPLPLAELAAVLRATRAVVAEEAKLASASGHNILTATYTLRDRLEHGVHDECAGIVLSEEARVQIAAAVCRAAYGRVGRDPVSDALRQSGTALAQLLETAAGQVAAEASIARAQALVGRLAPAIAAAVDADGGARA